MQVKVNPKDERASMVLRLPKKTLKELTAIAEKNKVSRQALIEGILRKVVQMKNFEVNISENQD